MSDCIFCKIVAGEIPSAKVYEDEKFLAFLDINPVNFGHTLLITKEHFENIEKISEELTAEIFGVARKILPKIKKASGSDFVALLVVGVEVPHFHIHLIPRYLNDGLENFWPTKKYVEGDLENMTQKIRDEFKDEFKS